MVEDEVVAIDVVPFTGEVFNLMVEDDNSYVIEGLAASNCLCFKTAVMMDETAFVDGLRDWLNDSSTWPEMDAFQQMVGGNVNVDLTTSQVAQHLTQWAFEDPATFD